MEKTISVLLVEPMKKPRVITIPHTLEEMQKLVDGYIQAVYPWDDSVALVCDEEALYKGKDLNRALIDEKGIPYDIVKGAFFICGLGEDDFCSISDILAEKYKELFYWPEIFTRTMDDHIVWTKLKPDEEAKVIV